MIASVHIAEVGVPRMAGLLRQRPDPDDTPGLIHADPVLTAPLGARPPRVRLGQIGLIAAWEDDVSLDGFLAEHPIARRFDGGWHVRLEPLRVFGSWAGMPGLPQRELPVDDDEPVVALTLGRPRLGRLAPFLRSSRAAERAAVGHPAVIAMTGFARPPRLVSTFSIWRSAAAMREYAAGEAGAHQAAVRADRARPFHHESAFVRFRPYASQGSWDGRNPLATI